MIKIYKQCKQCKIPYR